MLDSTARIDPAERDGKRYDMGTGRTLNKKPRTRPVKGTGDKRRREKTQVKRLIKLGMDPAAVAKLQSDEVREKLRQPKKIVRKAAK
jgi:hypothetical protein